MDFGGAQRQIEVALELDPKYVKAWVRKGDIESMMKEYHKAMESYKEGLELDPDNAQGPESVGTSSATTESRVEPDGSSVCPAPGPSSLPRSYAAVVAARTATNSPCSLVRSQRSEVNFRRSC